MAEITEAFVKQFNANIFHLSQQKGSRLRGAVRNESQKGKSQFFDRLGKSTAQKKSSRHSDTPLVASDHSRRRVTLNDYEHADLIDEADKIRLLIDPQSAYSENFLFAFGRAMDDEILDNMDGTAYSGEEGSTTVSHPNSQKLASVASGAGARLNVAALRGAKKKLDQAEVDPGIQRYCGPNAEQIESLLGQTEVTSADYNSVRALVMGEVDTFLGLKFIRTEQINTQDAALSFDLTTGAVGSGSGAAATYHKVPVWAKDGILLAIGQDMKTRVSERADKSYSMQVFASMGIGSTRLEEEKLVMLLCKPTV